MCDSGVMDEMGLIVYCNSRFLLMRICNMSGKEMWINELFFC